MFGNPLSSLFSFLKEQNPCHTRTINFSSSDKDIMNRNSPHLILVVGGILRIGDTN